jgi:outer membrane protein TolC
MGLSVITRAWPAAAVLLGLGVGRGPAGGPDAPPPAGPLTPRAAFGAPTPLPMPRELSPGAADELAWLRDGVMPIDLATALRLAATTNLDIAQGREGLAAARARLQGARASMLPTFNIGSTYNHHEGQIQKVEGNVITVNRSSLFVYGGPSLTLSLADALFQPLVATQAARVSEAGLQRVTNNTLLSVADAYFNVLRARRRLARTAETLEMLTSEQPSPLRAQARGLLPTVRAFVQAGGIEALRAELDRVRVEVSRREEERRAALQELRVATAELARLIRLDPATPLWPLEDFRVPVPLRGDYLADRPVEELLNVAALNRPELAEQRAELQAAYQRVRAAQFRPWVPNLQLTYNWGDFGGGPDPNPPIVTPATTPGGAPKVTAVPGFGAGGKLLNFNTRSDFDAALVWRFRNMGLGDLADIRTQQALQRLTQWRSVQVHDRVVAEVVQARELVRGWRERLDIIRAALFDAAGAPAGPAFNSMRLNFERIRNVQGTRPLEVLDSIRGLNDLLDAYGQAATEYERARFRLAIALGQPHQAVPLPPPAPPPADDAGIAPPP